MQLTTKYQDKILITLFKGGRLTLDRNEEFGDVKFILTDIDGNMGIVRCDSCWKLHKLKFIKLAIDRPAIDITIMTLTTLGKEWVITNKIV